MKHNVQIDAEAFGKFIDFVEGLKSSIVKQPEPVEPTCQIKNLDTGKTETMTREKAKLLQVGTKETHIFGVDGIFPDEYMEYQFTDPSPNIYTYKRKENLVKLNGKLMSRDAAIALWESKKDTCDIWIKNDVTIGWEMTNLTRKFIVYAHECNCEYELRERPLKQISWKDVPVGAVVINSQNYEILGREKETPCLFLNFDKSRDCISMINATTKEFESANYKNVKLAPADQQDWIAVQDGQTGYGVTQMLHSKGIWTALHESGAKYRITGISNGWKL